MAYKYQSLAATMSGSLAQEGDFTVKTDGGATSFSATQAGAVSGSGDLSAGGNLRTRGTVRFDGVADAAMDVASDSFYYLDGDNLMKKDLMSDYAAAIAGDGLAASSGVLSVSLTELTEAAVNVAADSMIFIDADGNVTRRDTFADYAAALVNSEPGFASAAGKIQFDPNSLAAASIASGDSMILVDANDGNIPKKETIDDIATLFAGAGLAAASAVLAVQASGSIHVSSDKVSISGSIAGDGLSYGGGVNSISSLALDLNELGAATIDVANDSFAIIDANASNASKKESIADFMTAVAGDGLAASSGVLAVGVDDSTIETSGDALRLKDDGVTGAKLAPAVAGYGLAQDGSGNLDLDLHELTAEVIASGDFLAFVDSTDNGTHKETVDDLATLFAGAGLTATSAVMAVANATNGGIGVQANDIKVDLNDLSAAAVNVAADSIAIIDADDSNATKKESIADLVAGMAGAGLSASNGQLSVQGNSVALKADGDTLAEGYNYFADLSGADATVTMPAAPSVGDVVTLKAGNLGAGDTITINKGSADHRIDGLEGIVIESPFGAVTMVYVVADHWKIV